MYEGFIGKNIKIVFREEGTGLTFVQQGECTAYDPELKKLFLRKFKDKKIIAIPIDENTRLEEL